MAQQATAVKPWLKNCPFCGEKAFIDDESADFSELTPDTNEDHIIGCSNDDCNAQPLITGPDLNKLIAIWNTRKG